MATNARAQGRGRRRIAALILLASTVSAAAAPCRPAWLPSCLAERLEASCVAAPTVACVRTIRFDRLETAMTADPDATRETFRSQSFELAISSTDAAERRRIAAANQRFGWEPNGFGEAVRAFAEDRFDWRARLAEGDVAGALAAVPRPDLGVSYQWIGGVYDAIFAEALKRGRVAEVIDHALAGGPGGSNWQSGLDVLADRWFRRLLDVDRPAAARLAGLGTPGRALSRRLVLAALDPDPQALATAFAREFPDPRPLGDARHRATESVWDAWTMLETRDVATRERFLDAMPRFVGAVGDGHTYVFLDGPVARGEAGIVRRLVARLLPSDEAAGLYDFAPGTRAEAIARVLPELDPADRAAAEAMMVEALIADGDVERALALMATKPVAARLFPAGGPTAQARRIALALAGRPETPRIRAVLARFDPDEAIAIRRDAATRAAAGRLLDGWAKVGPAAATDADDETLAAAVDLAETRGDCRGLLAAALARAGETSVADLGRALGRTQSCLETERETR